MRLTLQRCSFEIGAGTGTATRRLLDLGADPLTAVESDQPLAAFLRTNSPDKALKVVIAPFEDASLEEEAFDLGVSFTAFHWRDEASALVKIASLLRPTGWWAAVWNVFGDDSRPDPFHEATKEILDAPASPSAGEKGHSLRIGFRGSLGCREAHRRAVGREI